MLLIVLGYAMVATFMVLIMTNRLSAFVALILVPIVFGLLAGNRADLVMMAITGMVKLAPSLPLDDEFPFFHFERKFMHLGFQIYDTGFQSPNVDAARPMVFATTLLLLVIVVFLNLFAIATRNRLRRKYATSAV